VAANPFGRHAFTRQEESRIVVPMEKPLRVRFAVLVHSQPLSSDDPLPGVEEVVRERDEAYRDYLGILHTGNDVR
jgi:hypothetical protein